MGFYVTAFQYAISMRGASLLFNNMENSGNSRQLDPQEIVNLGNCWVPWCFKESDFYHRHIEILDTATEIVLWYIWQQDKPVRQVCASHTGFEENGPAIGGDATIGTSYNLIIGPGDDDLRTTPYS